MLNVRSGGGNHAIPASLYLSKLTQCRLNNDNEAQLLIHHLLSLYGVFTLQLYESALQLLIILTWCTFTRNMSRRVPNPAADRAAQNQQTIKTLLKLEGNKTCADCKRNKRMRARSLYSCWVIAV